MGAGGAVWPLRLWPPCPISADSAQPDSRQQCGPPPHPPPGGTPLAGPPCILCPGLRRLCYESWEPSSYPLLERSTEDRGGPVSPVSESSSFLGGVSDSHVPCPHPGHQPCCESYTCRRKQGHFLCLLCFSPSHLRISGSCNEAWACDCFQREEGVTTQLTITALSSAPKIEFQ